MRLLLLLDTWGWKNLLAFCHALPTSQVSSWKYNVSLFSLSLDN
jgi:hypothetical protein